MFKKILFATTGTPSCDAAARVAFDMAKRYNTELFIINVFGIPSRSFSQVITDLRTGDEIDLHDDQLATVNNKLKKIYQQQIQDYNTPHDIILTDGIPHTEILRVARKNEIDLIVMGARTSEQENTGSVNRHLVGRTLQSVPINSPRVTSSGQLLPAAKQLRCQARLLIFRTSQHRRRIILPIRRSIFRNLHLVIPTRLRSN